MSRWLAEDEQVLLLVRPHARVLVWPVGVGLLLVMAASAALAKLQPAQYEQWASAAPALREPAIVLLCTAVLLVQVAYPLRRVVRWAGTRYVLTSQRMVVKEGGLGRRQADYALAGVQGIDMRQKPLQRLAGAGELDFHMVTGKVNTVHNVPHIVQFRTETHKAWMALFRASFQQAPGPGYYAVDVGHGHLGTSHNDGHHDDAGRHLSGKELRKLGRDH